MGLAPGVQAGPELLSGQPRGMEKLDASGGLRLVETPIIMQQIRQRAQAGGNAEPPERVDLILGETEPDPSDAGFGRCMTKAACGVRDAEGRAGGIDGSPDPGGGEMRGALPLAETVPQCCESNPRAVRPGRTSEARTASEQRAP